MITSGHRQWFQKRIYLADELVRNHAKEGELDAEIILSCAISALAAQMWPGRGRDKKRFVQFLVEFSPISSYIQRVSTCVLITQLQQKGANTEADTLVSYRFSSKLAYDGKAPMEYASSGSGLYASTLLKIVYPDDIDFDESEVLTLISASRKDVRAASYVSIIYSDLRSGLVHEYELSDNLSAQGWLHDNDKISYVNYSHMPNEADVEKTAREHNIPIEEARDALVTSQRRLYFPYNFIRRLTIDTAYSAFDYWDSAADFSRPEPTRWWLEE